MAKPLADRLQNAVTNDRVTITDLRALIAEVSEERDRHLALSAAADADSVDIALSDDERDNAAGRASRSSRLVAGYVNALAGLEAELAKRLDSDNQRARAAEQAASVAERDKLADRWRETWPRVAAELVTLFRDTLANDARLSACHLPQEASSEALARGLSKAFHTPALGYVSRLTEIKLPALDHHIRLWPLYEGAAVDGERGVMQAQLHAALGLEPAVPQ